MSRNELHARIGWWRVLPIVAGVVAAAGCRSAAPQYTNFDGASPGGASNAASVTFTNELDPAWLKQPTDLYTLGPGDRLDIQLMGQPATKTTTVVGPDGKIYFDLLPGIDVWGLSLAQARARLEQAYSQYVREQPQISLVLRQPESKRIWILGRVQVPGVYTMSTPLTLLDAVWPREAQ